MGDVQMENLQAFSNTRLRSSKKMIEAKYTTFLMEMSFICIRMKNHFDIKGWALNLILMQRPGELGNDLLVLEILVDA